MKYCKFCKKDEALPAPKESNDHWVWENKKDRKSGGIHYCKTNRSMKKRASWDSFYKRKQLRCVVSRAINGKLKRRNKSKSGSIVNNMPYTMDELRISLESKFQNGMNWSNYGSWEIDHIIPDSSFNYDKMEDEGFKLSWNIDNLRPLWKSDNRRKYNKMVE